MLACSRRWAGTHNHMVSDKPNSIARHVPGFARGDYYPIPEVSKIVQMPINLFRLWLKASFVTMGHHH